MELNAEQLSDLAKRFKTMARAINDHQMDNWDKLSATELADLNKKERDLLREAQGIIAQTVVVTVADADAFIQEIDEVSEKIKKKLKQISDINKVIEIATASVGLAAAIVSKNPTAIGAALQGLAGTLKD